VKIQIRVGRDRLGVTILFVSGILIRIGQLTSIVGGCECLQMTMRSNFCRNESLQLHIPLLFRTVLWYHPYCAVICRELTGSYFCLAAAILSTFWSHNLNKKVQIHSLQYYLPLTGIIIINNNKMLTFLKNRRMKRKKQKQEKLMMLGFPCTGTHSRELSCESSESCGSSRSAAAPPLSPSSSSVLVMPEPNKVEVSLTPPHSPRQRSASHNRRPSLARDDFDKLIIRSRGWVYDPSESASKPHHTRDHNRALSELDFNRYIFAGTLEQQ
jgi:hypothetical protein